MTGIAQRPPTVEQFVKLPRDLLSSDAWRGLSINARRFIDFLMLEHMSHGGKENGDLKAPHRQLVAFGIGKDYVIPAIEETDTRGLVDCHRGGMRVATTFTLTWLPFHDGSPATNRWRTYSNPGLRPAGKSETLPLKRGAGLPPKGGADGPNLPHKEGADAGEALPLKGGALSRKGSYQGGAVCSVLEEQTTAENDAQRTARPGHLNGVRPW